MTFSEKLLLLRKQKRLSQEQLAEMLDVSRQSVSKWESQQTLPEPSKLILISQIFNVSIDQLLKDDMPMEGDEERTAANAEAAEPAPAVVKLDTPVRSGRRCVRGRAHSCPRNPRGR